MKTLQQLQESAREKMRSQMFSSSWKSFDSTLDAIIASTIEEVKRAMMLEAGGNIIIEGMLMNESGISGWNACRAEINRRFTELTSEQKGICK